jgi:hypothetical protein
MVACVWRAYRAAAAKAAAKKGRKRNLALLSFGDAAEEEEAQLAALGAKAKIRCVKGAAGCGYCESCCGPRVTTAARIWMAWLGMDSSRYTVGCLLCAVFVDMELRQPTPLCGAMHACDSHYTHTDHTLLQVCP